MAGDYKRAAGMAIYIGLGNLAGGKNHQLVGSMGYELTNSTLKPWRQTSTVRKMRQITSLAIL